MKKAVILATLLLLISSMLFAQHGKTSEEPAEPEITVFYFGQNIEGDVFQVLSSVRLDSRAPLGTIVGTLSGLDGELQIWLDSIVIVDEEAETPAEKPVEISVEGDAMTEDTMAAEVEGEMEAIDEMEESADTISMAMVEPPSGYKKPVGTFEIPISSLSTGNATRDELFKSEEYLNVAEFPTAVFELVAVSDLSAFKLADNQEIGCIGIGDLTLHGVTRRISNIRMFINYIEEKPVTRQNRKLTGNLLHFTAELSIKLSDFDIVIKPENLLTLDDKVTIMIDAFGTTNPLSAATE